MGRSISTQALPSRTFFHLALFTALQACALEPQSDPQHGKASTGLDFSLLKEEILLRIPPSEHGGEAPKAEKELERKKVESLYGRQFKPGEQQSLARDLSQLAVSLGLESPVQFAQWADWGDLTWQTEYLAKGQAVSNGMELKMSRVLDKGVIPRVSQLPEARKFHRRAVFTAAYYRNKKRLLLPIMMVGDGKLPGYSRGLALALKSFLRRDSSSPVRGPRAGNPRSIAIDEFAAIIGVDRQAVLAWNREQKRQNTSFAEYNTRLLLAEAKLRRLAILLWVKVSVFAWVFLDQDQPEWSKRKATWASVEERKCAALAFVTRVFIPAIRALRGLGDERVEHLDPDARVLPNAVWNGIDGNDAPSSSSASKTALGNAVALIRRQFAIKHAHLVLGSPLGRQLPAGTEANQHAQWFRLRSSGRNLKLDLWTDAALDIMRSVTLRYDGKVVHIPPLANYERVMEYFDAFAFLDWDTESCTLSCAL